MKLVTLIALASMTATAAPAFADSIVPGSDAAFYAQASAAPQASTTVRYGMPRTAGMNAAVTRVSTGDLVPGSDAAFAGPVSKAGNATNRTPVQPAGAIASDMVPGSDASFLN